MVSFGLFFLLLVSCVLADDVRDLCPGVTPITPATANAEGTWWIVRASKSSSGQCGPTNNQPPCRCTGLVYTTDLLPPGISKYNATLFGYDTETQVYEMQYSVTTIVDPTQPYAIFYLIDDSTGAINVGAALDTDNHETFIIFYFCSVLTSEGEPLVIVLSRSRNGLCSESQKRVDAALEANNICKDNLESFDVSDCADIYDYCFN